MGTLTLTSMGTGMGTGLCTGMGTVAGMGTVIGTGTEYICGRGYRLAKRGGSDGAAAHRFTSRVVECLCIELCRHVLSEDGVEASGSYEYTKGRLFLDGREEELVRGLTWVSWRVGL